MSICLEKIKHFYSYKYATYYFKIGVFLLLSAPAISVIFLLPSIIISLRQRKESFLKEKLNFCLIITAIFMIISCIHNSFPINFPYDSWSPSLSWYGIINWIPLFIFYFGFKSFLKTSKERRQISLLFIFGTIPLLTSGILQYFFKIYGPFETLNGLVIWFSRSLGPDEGLTGLFNNPNYAGAWLSLVFPFSLALCQEKRSQTTKIISYFICTTIVFVSIFTFSRSSLINIGLGSIFTSYKSIIFLIVPLILLIVFLLPICYSGFNFSNQISLLKKLFINRFCLNFELISLTNSHRIIIWSNALQLLKDRYIFGYGASSFSTIYSDRMCNELKECLRFTTHAHNILIEIAINYGLIASTLLAIFVSILLYKSFKKIYIKKNSFRIKDNFDKAWWTSIFVIALSHLYDNQYYDLRISISSWILLAGLSNIIKE